MRPFCSSPEDDVSATVEVSSGTRGFSPSVWSGAIGRAPVDAASRESRRPAARRWLPARCKRDLRTLLVDFGHHRARSARARRIVESDHSLPLSGCERRRTGPPARHFRIKRHAAARKDHRPSASSPVRPAPTAHSHSRVEVEIASSVRASSHGISTHRRTSSLTRWTVSMVVADPGRRPAGISSACVDPGLGARRSPAYPPSG